MNILIAVDSFKGSISSFKGVNLIEEGILRANKDFKKDITIWKVPISDGGEGIADVLLYSLGGEKIYTTACDPLLRPINSYLVVLKDGTAVVETALVSGLELLKSDERNPMITSTYGVGQLISKALDLGCKKIIVGVGGTSTNDGGTGMAKALGVKFLDNEGKDIGFGGGSLSMLNKVDLEGIDKRVYDTEIVVASDVANVLYGKDGASYVYAPQKGATEEDVLELDRNLRHFGDVIQRDLNLDVNSVLGAGAGGGLGCGIYTFLNGSIKPGAELVMEFVGFKEKARQADIIITGEGKVDSQTSFGKIAYQVGKVGKEFGKTVLCVCGTMSPGYEKLYSEGINAFFSIINRPMSLEEAIQKGEVHLLEQTENLFRLIFSII